MQTTFDKLSDFATDDLVVNVGADKTTPQTTMKTLVALIIALNGVKLGKSKLDLSNRPIFIDPAAGTDLPDNAAVFVTGYPFGSHKCMKAIFLDANKDGHTRVCEVTTKWAFGWNAVKTATFCVGVNKFAWNERGHVHVPFLYSWANRDEMAEFVKGHTFVLQWV